MNNVLEPPTVLSKANGQKLRWWICGLLFAAAVINYVDRQVFSILAPELQRDIKWSELDYGRIVIAFQLSYAVALAISGKIVDRIGTKLGYTCAFIWWSIAEMAHAFARSPFGFGLVRFVVGVGEGATFPTAIKTISEWFPQRESGLATGILNLGPTVGAIVAPIIVPLVAAKFGWRGAFVFTGLLGIVWLACWLTVYRPPEKVRGEAETAAVNTAATSAISWKRLLACRQTWAYGTGKLLADPAWFFYLFWLPKFLAEQHGLRGTAIIPYLTTIYVMTGFGSVAGGYCSSFFIKRGWSVNRSRKVTMGASAVIMPIVIVAALVRDPWTAVILIGIATAAHQSWSSLVFTMGTDLFPTQAIGAATGIAGALGSFATIIFAEITGRILQHNPTAYLPMFVACGLMYILALVIIHVLVPRLEPLKLTDDAESAA